MGETPRLRTSSRYGFAARDHWVVVSARSGTIDHPIHYRAALPICRRPPLSDRRQDAAASENVETVSPPHTRICKITKVSYSQNTK
eukprot:scaffold6199_cov132-Cylindrotheca_fusiformis.AAC.2